MKRFFVAAISMTVLFATFIIPSAAQETLVVSHEAVARELLAKMTVDEKIGQMIQADTSGIKDPQDVQTYHLGSILCGGGSDPPAGNSLENWTEFYESLQQRAVSTRLKIPVLFGIDAVHGHSNVLGAVIFPHNIGLGCTRNPELMQEIGRITALEMRATGIQWTFAPCVTVPRDERWGRTYEGFSEDPTLVAELGVASLKGLQGSEVSDPESVLACAKHFAGDGGTVPGTGKNGWGWDQGDSPMDEATFRRVHLSTYPPTIAAGALTIMPSYSSWNGLKCSANKYLLTDVLKGEFGFEGFLISDWEAIKQVHPDFKTAIGMSINAGMDMAMEPTAYREFYGHLQELVQEGTVPMSRIDDAVMRILKVKSAMGMLDENYDFRANRELQKVFGSDEHRQVARQAVRESLVVLKNDNATLPLSKSLAKVHVAGVAADDIGIQCGGWTIDWQGKPGEVTSGGTTILEAIKATVGPDTVVTFSADGSGAEDADAAIVVVGEQPYAEYEGDSKDLELSAESKATLASVKATGVPTVAVLLSGRPMIINSMLEDSDAFVAAWLPGTEGMGVTDILFGDFSSTGKLSFTWPQSVEQLPINHKDGKPDPLFPFGYGLE
jgi:beta-glucosidase